MRNRRLAVIGILPVLAIAPPAWAQLCGPTANPCVVSANTTVPSGTIVDIGTRDLVIASGKTLTVSGAGILTLRARHVTLESTAKIVAGGQDGFGGDVSIVATGTVLLVSGSRIDVQSASAGAIDIVAAAFQSNGHLRASATTRDGDGGLVGITTTGDATVAGLGIQASGGDRFSSGGSIDVFAGGSIRVEAKIIAAGGDIDGGDIGLDAAGDVVTTVNGELNTISTWPLGSGGAISIAAGGSVTTGGLIWSRGQGDLINGGGDGGDVDIIADGGDVTVNGPITIDGSAPDGSGGFLDVFATGTIAVHNAISASSGREGGGGDVILASRDVLMNGPVALQAGFIGGAFDLFATADATFTAAGDVDASTTWGAFGQFGGFVDVVACSVDLRAESQLLAVGNGSAPRASIRIRGTHSLRVAGTLQAGAFIELRYKDALPIFVPGFVVIPTPSLVFDTSLPTCVVTTTTTTTTVIGTTTTTTLIPGDCGNGVIDPGEQCDDGNPFDGDCCSSTCQFEPAGQPCLDDGNVCTLDRCNGLGTCAHVADNPGVVCRPAVGACDAPEVCSGISATCPPDLDQPDDTACNDDACFDGQVCQAGACTGGVPVVCSACEACDSADGCVAAPQQGCRQTTVPGRATLVVKTNDSAAKNKLAWKMARGQETEIADYGDPTTTDGFALCVYDESGPSPTVLSGARIPPAEGCADGQCWRATSTGFKYVDKLGMPDGIAKVTLKAGADAKSVVVLKGKGELLPVPLLPLGIATRVQLQGAEACWEATYSPAGHKRSDGRTFKGVSD